MFREMRRSKQLLPEADTNEILENGTTGIVSVLGDDEYPYGVPINYAYENNTIYFHCAKTGHKIDAIRKHDKVSFTVIASDLVAPAEFTTHFKSIIAFGSASVVENDDVKLHAMRLLNQKYSPDFMESGEESIRQAWNALEVVQIELEHVSGKQSKAFL